MAKCEICGKGRHFGIQVSHSHKRSNRSWKPNVKKVRVQKENGQVVRMNVCTNCLKSNKVQKAM